MQKILNRRRLILFFLAFFLSATNSTGEVEKGVKNLSQKPVIIHRNLLDVNQISAYYRNDGEFHSNHSQTGPGFEWPKGSGMYAIFSSGLWIGGQVTSDTNPNVKEIRVATVGHFGSEYRPGTILPNGEPDDFTKPEYRYYKVMPKVDLPNSNPDFMEWPVNQGAPYHDINDNGIYEPEIDKPAIILPNKIIYPDMMLFAVYNDADPKYHTWLWGRSKPLGVEVRQLNWAFDFGFADAHFIKFQIYNKSNNVIDSLYLAFWSDPDLGDAFDDYVGCDTTFDANGKRHNLGYCYNGDNYDGPPGYGLAPPAVGVKLFQGQLIYTGSQLDTAVAFGKKWIGYKNGNLSSFNFYCHPGLGGCTNPDWYDPSLYEQTYNIMKGRTRTDKPWIDPHTGDTVNFIFAGDPVTDVGFLNKDYVAPSDVRFTMPTGPLTLAPGDSQEVVYAVFVARGTSNLNSITRLREVSTLIQKIYDNNFEKVPYAQILPPNLYNPPFLLNVKIENALTVRAILKSQIEPLLGEVELFDDGNHNDSLANDGTWGNWLNSGISPDAAYLDLIIKYKDGDSIYWEKTITKIPTIGKPEIVDFDIISDNINGDKIINPGEDIRYKFKLKNTTLAPISNISINSYKTTSQHIWLDNNLAGYHPDTIQIGEISGWIPNQYFTFYVSAAAPVGYIGDIIYKIFSSNGNQWLDTISITVEDFMYKPIDTVSTHIEGISDSKFKVRLVDYSKLKDNEYRITITKISDDDRRYNLINATLNDTLLKMQTIPYDYYYNEHDMPIVDGFKILTNQVVTRYGLRTWKYNNNMNIWFTGVPGWYYAELRFRYGGLAAHPRVNTFGYESGYGVDDLKNILIIFSNHNTQKAYRYIAGFAPFPPILRLVKHPEFRPFVKDSVGFGFLYQDYEKYPLGNPAYGNTVPFTVWETDKAGNIVRQLDVGIVERNDSLYRWMQTSPTESTKQYLYYGNIDGKWNPSPRLPLVTSKEGDELILIFATTYTDTPKTIYTGGTTDDYRPHYNLLNNFSNVPAMYVLWMRRITPDTSFAEGDVLELISYFPVTEKDVYIFNPVRLLQNNENNLIPTHYFLYQNYPNPFNSTTTISYDVVERTDVEISVYDILGRKIKTLVKEEKMPGTYNVVWDGKNKNDISVSSGVYLVRYKAGPFYQSRKILLMR
ncbi:MAG: Cell surface protein [Ignavibacteriae bacterium]|nr:MAG: Cell surface protein [Ignavibacteriota bacterium]